MKKYTKPTAMVVELSVKESLSALPSSFGKEGFSFRMGTFGSSTTKNVSIYAKTSTVEVKS